MIKYTVIRRTWPGQTLARTSHKGKYKIALNAATAVIEEKLLKFQGNCGNLRGWEGDSGGFGGGFRGVRGGPRKFS